MTQNEQLRNLLKNARDELFIIRGRASLLEQIDAALAETVENSDARIKELETLLAFQKDMNASDLRLLRSFEAALDSTQVVIDRMNKELSEARAEAAKLRDALALSEVDVSLGRTWCRICRTENRSNERSRDAHPHEARCPLSRKDKP